MKLEFSSSEYAEIEIAGQNYEVGNRLELEVEIDWTVKIKIKLIDRCIEVYPSPKFELDSYKLTIRVLEHYILSFKTLYSTIPISRISLLNVVVETTNCTEIGSSHHFKEKNRSTVSLNDEVTLKELPIEEGLKYFEKIAFKKYDTPYLIVKKSYFKDLLAFNKPFEIKFDSELLTELKWQIDYDAKLEKCTLILKGSSKWLIQIVSYEPVFRTSAVLGTIDEKAIKLPKYDYSKVIQNLSEELMNEIHEIHKLMFGTQDRVVDKQDYQVFKDKLECLGITEKYKRAFKHILNQTVRQESFEKCYSDMCNKIREFALQKNFNSILSLNQKVPYFDAIKNSIFLAKVSNDEWSLQFYYDQVLVYHDTLQGKVLYGRYLVLIKQYDQAFELFLTLPECCEFEVAVCENYLGHVDTSLYRCQKLGNLQSTMFLYFKLKQDQYLDELMRHYSIVNRGDIESAVYMYDEMGLFDLSDELLRVMVVKHSVVEILINHLFLSRRYEDAKMVCNDDYIQYKLLAMILLKEKISPSEIQKLQIYNQNKMDSLSSQVILWLAVDYDVYFEDWSSTLQLANCPILYELLFRSLKFTKEEHELVSMVFCIHLVLEIYQSWQRGAKLG
eukprot:NODE_69_length_23719_cov_0.556689.p3 type:complete len:615 gc:universal NODE_69_length_23719_cov_0.556689:3199-1355(-)